MAKSSYLPQEDALFATWLSNFNTKLPFYTITFGLSAAQMATVSTDTFNFIYWYGQSELFKTESKERVAYKDMQRMGPLGIPPTLAPTAPVIPIAPAGVVPGIEPRIRILVQYIKNHPNYTVSIGQDLDIIGSEIVIDLPSLKPILTLVKLGAGIEVQWKKGVAHALRIEKAVIITAGPPPVWNFLSIDTEPHYLDMTPITTSQIWQYRAVYMMNDGLVGQFSDVSQIAVG